MNGRRRLGVGKRTRKANWYWRDRFFSLSRRVTPYVAVDTDAGVFFMETTDDHIGRQLFVERNRKEMRILARAVDRLRKEDLTVGGTTFVDVGANIGTTSIAALQYGFRQAIAIEPEPRNFRTLRINVAANGLEELVRTVESALSDREGTALLQVRAGRSGRHRLVAARNASRRANVIDVRAITVDALVEAGVIDGNVGLLWIDVEGHEPHVLAGARRLVERAVPLVIEFCPRHLERPHDISLLGDVIRGAYTHVLDLHEGADGQALAGRDAVETLAERYEKGFTDLLLWRTPPAA